MSLELIVTHSAGFFSCCSVRLESIVQFMNNHKRPPNGVDSSAQFTWYKTENEHNTNQDITFHYFESYEKYDSFPYQAYIDYWNHYQFNNYQNIQYIHICPVVYTYFSPNQEIRDIQQTIQSKYDISYENTCVLFYRGNDKNTETTICEYTEYEKIADQILEKNSSIRFLLQSDETEFIEYFTTKYPQNCVYFRDEARHIPKCDSTVDIILKSDNPLYSKYYLAITLIMAECKYIVCGSGNCSIWIMLYRGNARNVYQNLNGEWIQPRLDNDSLFYKSPRK